MNQNLQYFQKRSPILADRLKTIRPDPLLELLPAESGDLTVKKHSPNGSHRFIHSRIDPKQEARTWADNQAMIKPCLVIIGIGFAYHAVELLKKCRTIENALLIEADERMFCSAIKARDFSDLIQNPAIHFFIGSPLSVIETRLAAAFVQPFSRHIFSPVVSLCPQTYNPIKDLVEKHLCALRSRTTDGLANLLNHMSIT